jgi:hypothetical protein
MGVKEIKCANCGAWTDGNLKHCTHCNHDHNAADEADRKERMAIKDWEFPWIPIHESDHWGFKVLKYIGRGGQAVFFFIMSILAYIGSSAAH